MIKKLRIKLILASMFSIIIVLCIIMSTICFLNYRQMAADADSNLAILAENGGNFPMSWGYQEKDPPPGGGGGRERGFSPELPYELRYFSVSLDSEGHPITVNTGKIAAVNGSEAVEYARRVWEKAGSRGFEDDYRYFVHSSGSETEIFFLDCGRSLDTLRKFVITGIAVSLASLLVILLLLSFLSGRIVKPFSESYEKQRRFITDAGHELKTPLTIIDADAQILEMDFGENEWLQDIQQQTKRLADLTHDLILLSRMEEDRPQAQPIEFPLSDVVEETAQAFQALAKTQGKSLTCSAQKMISMYGDEKAVRRLITILLDNAVKYTEPDGIISLTLERQRNTVRLSVYNTTSFISRDHLEHLFERFYRTDQSRNSQTGGYGLGLSIAAAIVKVHKGKISASTEDEKSLRVTVTFPI